MTQVLAVLTKDYVLVASDRRLTYANGTAAGAIAHDNTCKLVSLCGVWGVAYTGLAQLEGRPTHEWIALRLAEKNCRGPHLAAEILADSAAKAVKASKLSLEQTFLIAGWARFEDARIAPHFLLVSNMFGSDGSRRANPGEDFNCFERILQPEELYAARIIGRPLRPDRGKHLDRLVRKILGRNLSPRVTTYALAREIANTAAFDGLVGSNVLAFCIPRAAALRTYSTGQSMILAAEPNSESAAFCYLNPDMDELKQYGPTHVCGESAVTDVETENDPSRDYQSTSIRILHLPKKESC